MQDCVIKLENVSKTFSVDYKSPSITENIVNFFKSGNTRSFKALDNINIEIFKGETFGIIGANGSGKSTLINIIMENIVPDKGGTVQTQGRKMRLSLGLGVDKNLTARENIYVNGSMIGLTFKEISAVFNKIIDFAGLKDFIDTPVKYYSRGMLNRLLFSIAIYANADIFLLDEFFGGVGDAEFKQKSDEAFQKFIIEEKTIVLVSHSIALIQKHCKRCLWLNKGKIERIGSTEEVIKAYRENQKRSQF